MKLQATEAKGLLISLTDMVSIQGQLTSDNVL